MTIEVLDSDAALLSLAPEWEALWRRCPASTPFQSPAWLLPWWRQFGTGMPRVAVARHAGQLDGLLPMYVLDDGGHRKLLPIGAGTTDYLDALGGPVPALLHALRVRARQDGVERCDLFDVPAWSGLLDAVPGWMPGNPCPVLRLGESPPGIWRKLRMNRNRAERAGGWTIETADADTLPGLMAELIRLHQARWTARGEAGSLAGPLVLGFHAEAAPALLAAGVLRLQALRLGGSVAAAIYALLAGPDRILFYLSGFDEAHGFVSPGTILLGTMLEDAAREGRTEAHFLRGQEGYKYAWGGVDRMSQQCSLTP